MSVDKEKIVALLERLEELRKRGLINEAEYEEKRNQLLSMYLELKPENKRPTHKERKALLITSIIIGLLASYSLKFVQLPNHTTTVTIIQEQKVTPTVIYPNTSSVMTGKGYNERIVYDGSLYLEDGCKIKGIRIDAQKGDVIKVVWESNDKDTYVAIGTDADYQKNVKGSFCEVMISSWKWIWPAASYGYSGSLEFTVPASATWGVFVANGNWECLMTECPITVTQLRIIHIEK